MHREAFNHIKTNAAVGIDGVTVEDYKHELLSNLNSLNERFKTGSYRATPVRRVYIPKAKEGETRPIGIPILEDKILQRGVTMVLQSVYEQEFKDTSYGFWRGRSAHQVIKYLRSELMTTGDCWLLEVDIQSFFDTLDHKCLRKILDRRVRDGVIRRTIDKWFEEQVKPRLMKSASLVRYADDFIIIFATEQDARKVMKVLPKRFEKFNLKLHPDKTRLIEFKPGSRDKRSTFDFLGFTFFWKRGKGKRWVVTQKTRSSRFRRGLNSIKMWCRKHRHWRVVDQHRVLSQKLQGHYAYYGITGNFLSINNFREKVICIWRKWLLRRSQKRRLVWDRYHNFIRKYHLPKARIVHSLFRNIVNPLF